MTTVTRAYKYRFYPDQVQEELLNQTFGCVRKLWNLNVAKFNDPIYNIFPEKINDIKLILPYMSVVAYNALEQKQQDWIKTKQQYFNKKRKTKLGRPKFKKKDVSKDSFRLSKNGFSIHDDHKIKLAKIGFIDIHYDRFFTGVPSSVTVSKNKSGQFYISVLVEEEVAVLPLTHQSIGLDMGITTYATLSNGTKIVLPKSFRENQPKLKKAQQHLARKTKGSKRHFKQKKVVAAIH